MNKMRPLTTIEVLNNVQQSGNMRFIDNFALLNTPIVPMPEELLVEHKAEVASSFVIQAEVPSCLLSVWYNLH